MVNLATSFNFKFFSLSPKWTILKNLIALNVAFTLLFATINSMASIQPIINQDLDLGTIGQIISFSINTVTCLVLPQVVIELIGFKFSLILGILLQTTYVAIQINLKSYTLIPASILTGFGNSLMWNTLGVYVTLCSKKYSKETSKDFIKVITLFFGISSSIYLLAYVLGYGLVGAILDIKKNVEDIDLALTTSSVSKFNDVVMLRNSDYDYANSCGIYNCPSTRLPISQSKPTEKSFNIFYAVMLSFCALAVLITFFFMDNMIDEDDDDDVFQENNKRQINIGKRFLTEIKNLTKLYTTIDVWLLFPLSFFSGFELTFLWFEYSRAFSACLLDVNYVGWTMIVFGACGSVITFGMGYLLKYIGEMTGIVFMIMVGLCQGVFMLSWTPNPNQGYLIFLMAIGFSLSESVANGQIRGLYGIYFKDSSAFSAANIGQTLGLFIGSVVSFYECTHFKTLFYVVNLLIALVFYIILALKHIHKKSKSNKVTSNDLENDSEMIKTDKFSQIDYHQEIDMESTRPIKF